MNNLNKLLSTFDLAGLPLKNRVVMAPMTRCRATENIPNDLMVTYYTQRSGAGLLITEGTSPAADGLGYARIPGIYNEAQKQGWKKIADAVHKNNSKIFMQLMHCGRICHSLNMAEGTTIMAPSAIAANGEMWTDQEGMKPLPTPKEMTETDIEKAINSFVEGSKMAIEAGIDGIELHGANGYLIDQFLNPASNQRTDDWGGTPEKRNRFALEVAKRVTAAIGANKVGIRLSPYGAFNDVNPNFDGLEDQYTALAKELGNLNMAYLHIVDHEAMGAPAVPQSIKVSLRENFKGAIILSGGYEAERAEADLIENKGDLIAFGRPFISNPNLVEKMGRGAALTPPNMDLFYTPGEEGYTTY